MCYLQTISRLLCYPHEDQFRASSRVPHIAVKMSRAMRTMVSTPRSNVAFYRNLEAKSNHRLRTSNSHSGSLSDLAEVPVPCRPVATTRRFNASLRQTFRLAAVVLCSRVPTSFIVAACRCAARRPCMNSSTPSPVFHPHKRQEVHKCTTRVVSAASRYR